MKFSPVLRNSPSKGFAILLPFLLASLFLLGTMTTARAVATASGTNTIYNTTDNISSSLSSWSSGWGSGGDGWNYVGSIVSGSASGTYLGNGWVLTASHVAPLGAFTLNGNTYNLTGVSYSNFTNSSTGTTNADLTLLQIETTSTTGTNLTLSSLTLASSTPSLNSTIAMIGYGGASGFASESWGTNTVSARNQITLVNTFASIDFVTSGPNTGYVVTGDSGGGDFIKNGSAWQLAGINEAIDTNNTNSYLIQLSSYASQINSITAVPEPSTWALLGLSVGALITSSLWRGRKRNC